MNIHMDIYIERESEWEKACERVHPGTSLMQTARCPRQRFERVRRYPQNLFPELLPPLEWLSLFPSSLQPAKL